LLTHVESFSKGCIASAGWAKTDPRPLQHGFSVIAELLVFNKLRHLLTNSIAVYVHVSTASIMTPYCSMAVYLWLATYCCTNLTFPLQHCRKNIKLVNI